MLYIFFGTGGGIRTPINGFGDRYSTLELRPFYYKNQQRSLKRPSAEFLFEIKLI